MTKILVTGATGFIGSYVLNSLLQSTKENIIVLKRSYSNCDRIKNLISDKRNGYLMPMDDIHKFVATIHTLIKNSKLLTDLQMSAYNSAKEKFSIKTMSHNYKKYLSDIVKDK